MVLQRWRKYLRERRLRKRWMRLVRERLAYLGYRENMALRPDWEILDLMAGLGWQRVEALYQAKRAQEMSAAAGTYRGDPRLN